MPPRRALWIEFLIFALVLLSSTSCSWAVRVNITVDDSESGNGLPSIIYSPPGAWNIGNNCSACTAKPAASDAHGGTWHDATFPANGSQKDLTQATLVFNGSAIYVFCIIANSVASPTGTSDMSFYIDGKVVGGFWHAPSGNTSYQYSYPVYSNSSLSPGIHSFTMVGGHIGGVKSLILLDYIVYSQDVAPPPLSSSPKSDAASPPTSASFSGPTQLQETGNGNHTRTAAIAAAVPSCLLALAAIVAGIVWYRRRKRHQTPARVDQPTEPNITEDPSSSGWVEDAFGRPEGSGIFEHPSLTPKGSIPEGLRGNPTTRGAPKYRRDRSFTESSSASAAGQSDAPLPRLQRPMVRPSGSGSGEGSSSSIVAIEMTKLGGRSGRHPYAAPTPEPDIEPIVDESDRGQPIASSSKLDPPPVAEPSPSTSVGPSASQIVPPPSDTAGSPATISAPSTVPSPLTSSSLYPLVKPPTRQRSATRPLPMRPVLESQAHAARLRRQNSSSATLPTTPPAPGALDEAPPSYEASRAPHAQR
ncbi:hypothetical protein BC629DRAFT_1106608 [Irpex lacteus]|nr:hypothetical protein BC629DRAFT_1106608 [Irpex lacteus]